MKKLKILPAIFILSFITPLLLAQNCDFTNAGVRFNYSYINPVTGKCNINLDLYFDLKTNAGSKYIVMHIWPVSVYPDLIYSSPPDSGQLAIATTMLIHHFQNHNNSHMDSVYKPDTRVKPLYMDMVLTVGPSNINTDYDRFTITNINLEVGGGCDIPQAFMLDMWSTESESMNQVHCMDKGVNFYANNPKIIGLMTCQLPRSFNIQINSIDPAPLTVNYNVYIDNGDNVFNVIEDTLNIKSESGITIAGNTYNSGTLSYLPYSNIYPYANMNLWVVATSPSLPNTFIAAIENTCAALPVKLISFNAVKKDEMVILTWITTAEFSNTGFSIERKSGNGNWENIGFVNSKAGDNNSLERLDYFFTDNHISPGVLQYRLKQVDINGNFSYSPVRVVNNNARSSVVIFPNPSVGSINIAFQSNDLLYSVFLYSPDGKMIRNWQNCNSILNVQILKPGIYLLKVEENENKTVSNHKIVIR